MANEALVSPENAPYEATAFIETKAVGSYVLKLVNDPDVLSVQLSPSEAFAHEWQITWQYIIRDDDDAERHLTDI